MGVDAIDNIIESNEAREAKLREQGDYYKEKQAEAKEQKRSIWLEMRAFLHSCGVLTPTGLNAAQQEQFDALTSSLWDARMDYVSAGNRFMSTNLSLFNLVLETGDLKQQQLLNNHIRNNLA